MEGLPWTLSSRPFGKRKAMAGTKQELLDAWKAAAAGWIGSMRGKAAALLQGAPLRLRPARFGLGAHPPLPRRWPRRAQPQQRPTRFGLGTNPPLPRRWPRRAQPQHRQKARRASRRHGPRRRRSQHRWSQHRRSQHRRSQHRRSRSCRPQHSEEVGAAADGMPRTRAEKEVGAAAHRIFLGGRRIGHGPPAAGRGPTWTKRTGCGGGATITKLGCIPRATSRQEKGVGHGARAGGSRFGLTRRGGPADFFCF